MWSQLEPNVAITCACVPLMRPVFGSIFASYSSRRRGSKYDYIGPGSQGDGLCMQSYAEKYTRKASNVSKVQPYECSVVGASDEGA